MDLAMTIEPKSDQLNSDDLIAGPMTVKITKVAGSETKEQPVSIFFEGDNGKPYKPCKSMRRVLVQIWGRDGAEYVGRSMTLYRDPEVKFGGIGIGGIRISHMTDLAKEITLVLTASKTSRKPFVVQPLKVETNGNGKPDDERTIALKKLFSDLNAAKDEIKWTAVKAASYSAEFFGRDIPLFANLTDDEKDKLAAHLQERLAGLLAPEPTVSESPTPSEPETVSATNDRPADTDEAAEASASDAETDPLESLRANAQAMLDSLEPKQRKNLLAGKPLPKDMGPDELNQLMIDARKLA